MEISEFISVGILLYCVRYNNNIMNTLLYVLWYRGRGNVICRHKSGTTVGGVCIVRNMVNTTSVRVCGSHSRVVLGHKGKGGGSGNGKVGFVEIYNSSGPRYGRKGKPCGHTIVEQLSCLRLQPPLARQHSATASISVGITE